MGCRSCEIACAVEHSLTKNLFTAIFEKPRPVPRIRIVVVDEFYVPIRCQHCRDAPCIAVCPTKALHKTDEGFVVVDPVKCIGCLMCVLACPFGHPRYSDELGSIVKCDFCVNRVRKGLVPACVEACPTGALRFGKLEDIMKEVAEEKIRALLSGRAGPGLVLVKPVKEVTEKRETVPSIPMLRRMYGSVRIEIS